MDACIHWYKLHTTIEQSRGTNRLRHNCEFNTRNSLPFSNTPIYIYTSPWEDALLEYWSTMLSGCLLKSGQGVYWYVPLTGWD
jgi:hypothetical protein